VVSDNFGTNFRLPIAYARGDEKNAHEILDRLAVRYVVVDPHLLAGSMPFPPDSIAASLYFHDGSERIANTPTRGRVRIPALGRHRLVAEFAPFRREEDRLKLFEYVRGARLVGAAPPGKLVHVRLPLRTDAGRAFVYRATAKADAGGRYAFRLPYANRGSARGVAVHPHYVLTCGDTSRAPVSLEERQVRAGEKVVGPDLCR
jgi:hypothetical protein